MVCSSAVQPWHRKQKVSDRKFVKRRGAFRIVVTNSAIKFVNASRQSSRWRIKAFAHNVVKDSAGYSQVVADTQVPSSALHEGLSGDAFHSKAAGHIIDKSVTTLNGSFCNKAIHDGFDGLRPQVGLDDVLINYGDVKGPDLKDLRLCRKSGNSADDSHTGASDNIAEEHSGKENHTGAFDSWDEREDCLGPPDSPVETLEESAVSCAHLQGCKAPVTKEIRSIVVCPWDHISILPGGDHNAVVETVAQNNFCHPDSNNPIDACPEPLAEGFAQVAKLLRDNETSVVADVQNEEETETSVKSCVARLSSSRLRIKGVALRTIAKQESDLGPQHPAQFRSAVRSRHERPRFLSVVGRRTISGPTSNECFESEVFQPSARPAISPSGKRPLRLKRLRRGISSCTLLPKPQVVDVEVDGEVRWKHDAKLRMVLRKYFITGWNSAHPDAKIMRYGEIIEVNGVYGTRNIRRELQSRTALRLRVWLWPYWLEDFHFWMVKTRNLEPGTAGNYIRFARRYMVTVSCPGTWFEQQDLWSSAIQYFREWWSEHSKGVSGAFASYADCRPLPSLQTPATAPVDSAALSRGDGRAPVVDDAPMATLKDAPPGHAAHAAVRLQSRRFALRFSGLTCSDREVRRFDFEHPDGGRLHVKVTEAGGSEHHAARIARLCHMRSQNGTSLFEARKYRDELLERLRLSEEESDVSLPPCCTQHEDLNGMEKVDIIDFSGTVFAYDDLFAETNIGEPPEMQARRRTAHRGARRRLEQALREKRQVSEQEVLSTLQEWEFAKNISRTNVIPDGQEWVYSNTLGLVQDRAGRIHATPPTLRYPDVTRLIVRWLRDNLPPEMADFTFTSLSLNKDYAAKLHRDRNNIGPSMIRAFGAFGGGELSYWPSDPGSCPLDELQPNARVKLPIGDGLALFNGNRAHAVEPFKGERLSIVFFTSGVIARAPPQVRAQLERLGFPLPAQGADISKNALMSVMKSQCGGGKSWRFWPKTHPQRHLRCEGCDEPVRPPRKLLRIARGSRTNAGCEDADHEKALRLSSGGHECADSGFRICSDDEV